MVQRKSCKYDDWIAKSQIDLVDSVGGSKPSERVLTGEKIKALTGEVHTVPNEAEVLKDHNKFKRGDKFYLLTYQGEGFYRVWSGWTKQSKEFTGQDSCS